jgi:hypothetical protein
MVQGDDQRGPPGAALPDPLIVRVTDSSGSPLAGQSVTWTVNGGAGAIDPASERSNAEGLVFAQWILGPAAGLNVVEARVAGPDAVTFTATAAAPGAPEPRVARLIYRFPPPDFVRKGEPFPVKVALVDAAGDAVPLDGILIYLGLFPEGSESPTNQAIEGSRFESTVDGIATFEIAVDRNGKYRLRALTDDLPELGPHGPEPWLYSKLFEVK